MFKKIDVINGVLHHYGFCDNKLVVVSKAPNGCIELYDINTILKEETINYPAYDFVINDDKIIFSIENKSSSMLYSVSTKKTEELSYLLHLKGMRFESQYLCFAERNDEEKFLLVSLETLKITKELDANLGLGGVDILMSNQFLSTKKRKGLMGLYSFENEQIWNLDLSNICSYDVGNGKEIGSISRVYTDSHFFYVLVGLSVVKVAVDSGTIVWQAKFNTAQSRGLIHDGFIYTTSNAYLNKTDIESGEILYEVEFDYFNFEHKKTLGPIMELVWCNDGIWTIMDSVPNALIEFNTSNGSYKNIIPLKELGIQGDCHMPRFHENRMYILDFEGTLHVFEDEN